MIFLNLVFFFTYFGFVFVQVLRCSQISTKGLGMSFSVRFKVRMFGNKHPDGSNVRTFFSDQIIVKYHVC